jgi:microcystin-dependent protein
MSLYRTDNNGNLIKVAGNITVDNLTLLEQLIADSIKNKVDKIEGKSLSTNDYTTNEKNQVAKITTITSDINTIKSQLNNILLQVYPIGSIYISTVNKNPKDLFGGTWEPFAAGRTIIGNGTSDKAFTAGNTGGSSTHTLTTSEMPSHTHTQNSHNHTQNSHNHTQNSHNHSQNQHRHTIHRSGNGGGQWTGMAGSPSNTYEGWPENEIGYTTATNNAATATNNATTATNNAATATNQNTGGGSAHNNLPPYIVTYIWKRTA